MNLPLGNKKHLIPSGIKIFIPKGISIYLFPREYLFY